jgi:hypothetical protein
MTLDVSNLDHDQRAYFEHITRPGTAYELVQRRDQLRTDLSGNTRLGSNRKAALLALNVLHDRTNPRPTQAEQEDVSLSLTLGVAQGLFDRGDDKGATRILANDDLDLSYLEPRHGGADFAEREEACRIQYRDKRHDAIIDLKRTHSWTDDQAKKFFDGDSIQRKRGGTLDGQLRREVNLNHRFPGDREI